VPPGGHADGDDGHDRAEDDARDVGLQVHRRREVEAQRQEAHERDRQVQPDRERHVRRELGEERHVDAVADRGEGADGDRHGDGGGRAAGRWPIRRRSPSRWGKAPSSNQVS
jgi:hypothetical protein